MNIVIRIDNRIRARLHEKRDQGKPGPVSHSPVIMSTEAKGRSILITPDFISTHLYAEPLNRTSTLFWLSLIQVLSKILSTRFSQKTSHSYPETFYSAEGFCFRWLYTGNSPSPDTFSPLYHLPKLSRIDLVFFWFSQQ
ncbi:hypothetical protein GOODEAATRI_012056 [Goodea atripinnis]|uniref:Uncharacterized protein n=1 Tax=Goodea atripinnis TaxID=208336 RepID=A0ABV0PMU8_9TELE